ncbi:rab GTPase-binding effector protein 1-like isoform X2 [Anopheles albimanus]|uniref:Uncharacterized protein n=1 Tax=Anopheles albimanus TaxID=7167 RepID=A0A182FJV8_ANOAL|nr:rab GTPase-binding effector protein 1-like isoform X2 [Anopheles albimanus]
MENKDNVAEENDSSAVVKIETEDEATKLQAELSRVREEFNQQRARMKELYLAKENECKRVVEDLNSARKELNELKAQIQIIEFSREKDAEDQRNRMEDENRTLKQLVNETLDESSVMRDTVRQLQEKNKSMLAEITQLREGLAESNQVSPSLAKTVQQAKKIILKFGTIDSNSSDNLEESMRKAQEDAEVLRSLVVPLEEEIKSLKEKLRLAYETRETSSPGAGGSTKQQKSALLGMLKPEEDNSESKDFEGKIDYSQPDSKDSCIRCAVLENSVEEQLKEERERSATVEKQVERLKEQLTKEAALRTDLEAQWHKKREEHKIEVQKLTDRAMKTEMVLDKLRQDYSQLKLVLRDELQKLTEERERVYYQINNLQQDNDFLAGKYVASSEALKDQALNFPQTVDALQEYVLRLHEKLIVTQTGCEFAERKARSMQDEVTLLQEQQCLRDRDAKKAEQEYTQTCMQLQERLRRLQNEFQQFVVIREELEVSVSDHEKQNSELRMQIIELQAGNERLDKQVCDLKSKMAVLQEDLANNEAVQKDFVKLSQSLQMQLEKIRSADTQVRWQDDDDVDQCPNCKKEFTVTRRKQHCRHCGTIYCQPCLSKSVVSGPNRRPAKVCDVCHTLLVQDTAPYFSREPPQSP